VIHARPTKFALVALTLTLGSLTASASATVDPFDGAWHFSLTPYLWTPNINGSIEARIPALRTAAGDALRDVNLSAEVGPNDYLENLKFAGMVTGEARKGEWSVLTDLIYMDLAGPAGPGLQLRLGRCQPLHPQPVL
jgi:hypothetical protein